MNISKFSFDGPEFLSRGDENAFFARLGEIACIVSVFGRGLRIEIDFGRLPRADELREMIALLYRYNLDMRWLAAFRTSRNSKWFSENKNAYWYPRVFGESSPSLADSGGLS